MADVVLPAANAYEKSGTFTNTCGDLQLREESRRSHRHQERFRNDRAHRRRHGLRRPQAGSVRQRATRADMGQSRGAQSGEADRHAVWLEAHELEPKMSPFDPMAILDEIQRLVPGYDVSRINLLAGNDQHTTLSSSGPGTRAQAGTDPAGKRQSVQLRNARPVFEGAQLGHGKSSGRAVGSRGGLSRSRKRSPRLFALNGLTNKETHCPVSRCSSLASVIKIVLVVFILLTAVAYTVWLERKVVGPHAEPLGTHARRSVRPAAAAGGRRQVHC